MRVAQYFLPWTYSTTTLTYLSQLLNLQASLVLFATVTTQLTIITIRPVRKVITRHIIIIFCSSSHRNTMSVPGGINYPTQKLVKTLRFVCLHGQWRNTDVYQGKKEMSKGTLQFFYLGLKVIIIGQSDFKFVRGQVQLLLSFTDL